MVKFDLHHPSFYRMGIKPVPSPRKRHPLMIPIPGPRCRPVSGGRTFHISSWRASLSDRSWWLWGNPHYCWWGLPLQVYKLKIICILSSSSFFWFLDGTCFSWFFPQCLDTGKYVFPQLYTGIGSNFGNGSIPGLPRNMDPLIEQ